MINAKRDGKREQEMRIGSIKGRSKEEERAKEARRGKLTKSREGKGRSLWRRSFLWRGNAKQRMEWRSPYGKKKELMCRRRELELEEIWNWREEEQKVLREIYCLHVIHLSFSKQWLLQVNVHIS